MLAQRTSSISKVRTILCRDIRERRRQSLKDIRNRFLQFKNDVVKSRYEIKEMIVEDILRHKKEKRTLTYRKYRITKRSKDLFTLMKMGVRRRDIVMKEVEDIFLFVFYYVVHSPHYFDKGLTFVFNLLENEYNMIIKFFSSTEIHLKVKRKAVIILIQIFIPFIIFVEQYILHFHIVKDMVWLLDAKEIRPI